LAPTEGLPNVAFKSADTTSGGPGGGRESSAVDLTPDATDAARLRVAQPLLTRIGVGVLA